MGHWGRAALTAVRGEEANIPADDAASVLSRACKTLRLSKIPEAERKGRGVGAPDSFLAHEDGGRVLAQPETGGMFNRELTVCAHLVGFHIQITADGAEHILAPPHRAGRIAAHPDDGLAHRLSVGQPVKE